MGVVIFCSILFIILIIWGIYEEVSERRSNNDDDFPHHSYNHEERFTHFNYENLDDNSSQYSLKPQQSIKPFQITVDFEREQRNKMKRKYKQGLTLRDYILKRDNYTCQKCGNSKRIEPNLLLEVDHIYPVSKGGLSIPENLQTLCWKCNRSKSNK